jgi:hypothetical protein
MRQPAPDIRSTAQECDCSYKKQSSAESDVTSLSFILIGRRIVKQNLKFLKKDIFFTVIRKFNV